MFKAVMVGLLAVLISGCSSAPSKPTGEIVYVPPETKNETSGVSEISTACSEACINSLEKLFGVNFSEFGAVSVMAPVLEQLDGVRGSHSPQCIDCSGPTPPFIFNDPWDFNYRIKVPEGKHSALVSVQYAGAAWPSSEVIEFRTSEGKSYFLGQILVTMGVDTSSGYKWHPVVVELASGKVVYPESVEWRAR